MPKDSSLDRYGRRRDGLFPGKSGDRAKQKSAQTAQVETLAPFSTSDLQLPIKNVAMSALVFEEVVKFGDHFGRSPSCKPSLCGVDADGPVLAGMVHFHDAVTQSFAVIEPSRYRHAILPPAILPHRPNPR